MNASGRKGRMYNDFRRDNLRNLVENERPDIMFLPGDSPGEDTFTQTSYQQLMDPAHYETVLRYDSICLKVQSIPFNSLWFWESPSTNGRRIFTSSYKFGRQKVLLRSMELETDSRKRFTSLIYKNRRQIMLLVHDHKAWEKNLFTWVAGRKLSSLWSLIKRCSCHVQIRYFNYHSDFSLVLVL